METLPDKTACARVVPEQGAQGKVEVDKDAICRYCFEDSSVGELISPCRCAGGQKYVHLVCLRLWQKAVLGSQPTHPDFYDIDQRQRVCNVCKEEFSCPPPTRAELMATFTGPELAALIDEGSLIGSAEDFSRELETQLEMVPPSMRSGIACQSWIRGIFLIVRVVQERRQQQVSLRLDGPEDVRALIERVGVNGRTIQLRGRRYTLLPAASFQELTSDDSPEAWRRALSQVCTPATLPLQPEADSDCGEDGIVAVNLVRPFDISEARSSMRSRQRAVFCDAMQAALVFGGYEMDVDIRHFVGGPCEEDEVAACMVINEGKYFITRGLPSGLELAAATARRLRGKQQNKVPFQGKEAECHTNLEEIASRNTLKGCRRRRGLWIGACRTFTQRRLAHRRKKVSARKNVLPTPSPAQNVRVRVCTKRHRPQLVMRTAPPAGSASSSTTLPAELSPLATGAVRLYVFWGYAGWSRCQLMGEIARGSWGLCQSRPADILEHAPGELWQAVYPRMILAPKNEMSETYGGHSPDVTRRRDLRQMAIFHDIIRRNRAALVNYDTDESGGGEEGAPWDRFEEASSQT